MNEKNKWKIRVLYWILAIVGAAIIGTVCAFAMVSPETLTVILWVYVIALVLVWLVINMTYVSKLAREVNALLPILRDENDPDRYLDELNNLIGDSKSKAFRSILCLNSSAAYCDKEDYETAKSFLLQLDPKSIPGVNRLVYYLNMALISIHLGDDDAAMDIWNGHKDEFEKYKDSEHFGPAISAVRFFSMIKENRKDDALAEIEKAKQKWTRPRELKQICFMEGLLGE
ncbi:MAG: hypothetical protein K6E56_02675 [Lachnospiraceae bacterium]|nr:hypothetical protein [Lachnospiraceae bacterium]